MNRIVLTTVLFLNFSTAQAFDWMDISKVVNVGSEYSAVVSKVKYKARWEADGHCKQLGRQLSLDMRLADLQEVIEIAAYGKPVTNEMMVQIKQKDGTVKHGIVAWDNKKPIKVNIENPSIKDTDVVFTFRGGSGAVINTSLKEMKESDVTVVDYQDKPLEKIPAFCVHNKK